MMKIRVNKKKEYSVYKKKMMPYGKHYTEKDVAKVKCFMDDPAYSYLDIALACGMRLNQIGYLIRKIKREQEKERILDHLKNNT